MLRSFLHELRPQLGSAGLATASAAVDELAELGRLLVDWGLPPEQTVLEPLLTPSSEYLGGVLFQVSLCLIDVHALIITFPALELGLSSLQPPSEATLGLGCCYSQHWTCC